jgi:hypothetical protein
MELVQTNLFDHPALIAWRKIETGQVEPKGIETLQEKKKKPAVYRLWGVGPYGVSIIAKRCQRIEAIRERTIYEKVLPRLPFPSLRVYGFLEEDDLEYAWLFLEDVGGENYSMFQKNHQVLAARWLGLMHTSAAHLTDTACLRSLGPDYYLECLRKVWGMVMRNLFNPALTADDVAVLKAILSQCEMVESHWSLLDCLCKRVPRTLVHSSFRKDNMRVLASSSGNLLMVFDLGAAGCGTPARDIAKLEGPSVRSDINVYLSAIRDRWPILDVKVIQTLLYVGQVFRCFEHMTWAAVNLCYECVAGPMNKMRKHKTRLDKFTEALWGT